MTGKAPHGVVALLHLAGVFVTGNVKDPDHQCCLQLSPPHRWIVIFVHTWRTAGLFLSQPGRVKPWEQL